MSISQSFSSIGRILTEKRGPVLTGMGIRSNRVRGKAVLVDWFKEKTGFIRGASGEDYCGPLDYQRQSIEEARQDAGVEFIDPYRTHLHFIHFGSFKNINNLKKGSALETKLDQESEDKSENESRERTGLPADIFFQAANIAEDLGVLAYTGLYVGSQTSVTEPLLDAAKSIERGECEMAICTFFITEDDLATLQSWSEQNFLPYGGDFLSKMNRVFIYRKDLLDRNRGAGSIEATNSPEGSKQAKSAVNKNGIFSGTKASIRTSITPDTTSANTSTGSVAEMANISQGQGSKISETLENKYIDKTENQKLDDESQSQESKATLVERSTDLRDNPNPVNLAGPGVLPDAGNINSASVGNAANRDQDGVYITFFLEDWRSCQDRNGTGYGELFYSRKSSSVPMNQSFRAGNTAASNTKGKLVDSKLERLNYLYTFIQAEYYQEMSYGCFQAAEALSGSNHYSIPEGIMDLSQCFVDASSLFVLIHLLQLNKIIKLPLLSSEDKNKNANILKIVSRDLDYKTTELFFRRILS